MAASDSNEPPLSSHAIETLVQNHREFLRFLERRVGPGEAEDILQQAFVKGVEHAGTLRDGESVTAWFYRILRNAVIDRHRRLGAKSRGLDGFARELERAVEPLADTKDAVCACVQRLAGTLKPEYAEALHKIEIEGMSVQGYAEEIGIQPNNAAVRVHRAREALRKRVMASCGTCAQHGCLDCTCQTPTG
jgi:RNA polymerase sigma-70 factor (ECF subfamily)